LIPEILEARDRSPEIAGSLTGVAGEGSKVKESETIIEMADIPSSSKSDPMSAAFAAAKAAGVAGEVPVGAAIVREQELIAYAGNRTIAENDPTAHAEMLVIRAAAKALGAERLAGCDLYVTLEPCAMCAAAISFARIRRLYYAASDEKGGAVEHGARFFSQPTCHHAPEVYEGLRASEAAALLREFFAARR
jgi:tRNA(adenine34) deaminase